MLKKGFGFSSVRTSVTEALAAELAPPCRPGRAQGKFPHTKPKPGSGRQEGVEGWGAGVGERACADAGYVSWSSMAWQTLCTLRLRLLEPRSVCRVFGSQWRHLQEFIDLARSNPQLPRHRRMFAQAPASVTRPVQYFFVNSCWHTRASMQADLKSLTSKSFSRRRQGGM